jgi:ATP-dependent Zn protease
MVHDIVTEEASMTDQPFAPIEHGNMTDSLRGTAFHEAGHAVVAWSLGLLVDSIAIDCTKGGAQIDADQDHLSLTDRLAVRLAGTEAEDFFDAHMHDLAGLRDRDEAERLIGDAVPDDKVHALIDDGHARARKLIVANENRCRRLAVHLQEHRQVSADEFRHSMMI